jgi:hypothetical protein
MKMRRDWAAGRLAALDADYQVWRHGIRAMQRKYGVLGRFSRDGYIGGGVVQGRHGNPSWNDRYVSHAYKGGAYMEANYARLGQPMLEWKWKYNPGPEADSLPRTSPDFDDRDWPATHVVRDTWSSLGHHLTLTDAASGRSGRMAYRATQRLGAPPEGKRVFLWIGSTDGRAKVFVNGAHIAYVTSGKNETREEFNGYCLPTGETGFDVTAALKAGDNQFTILCDRYNLNELCTGGLMGPVVLYREK